MSIDPKIIDQITKETLKQTNVIVWCTNCYREFLNIPLSDYIEKHDWEEGDMWMVKSCLHYLKTNHVILLTIPNSMVHDISDMWERKMLDNGITWEDMLAMFTKHENSDNFLNKLI